MVVYNVHCLVHLANEVRKYGCLDTISAFPFENFMQFIKRLIRKPNLPLQQAIHRLSEMKGRSQSVKKEPKGGLRRQHHGGPKPHGYQLCRQYKEVFLQNFHISTSQGDNCVRVGNDVALVRNILQDRHSREVKLVLEKYSEVGNFYTYPLDSIMLGIFEVAHLCGELEVVPSGDIKCKCLLLPHQLRYVAVSFH